MAISDHKKDHFTPIKDNQKGFETVRNQKHVKFIDFKANANKKPPRRLEDSEMVPSKHSLITNSPLNEIEYSKISRGNKTMHDSAFNKDNSMTPVSMRMTPPSKTLINEVIELEEADLTLMEEKRQLRIRSTPKGSTYSKQLTNETLVKENLNKIAQEYAQSVEDYQNDTNQILSRLQEVSGIQEEMREQADKFKIDYIGLARGESVPSHLEDYNRKVNQEHILDIQDLKDINTHKQRELKKLEKDLQAARVKNQSLRAKVDLNTPDDVQGLSSKMAQLSSQNRKKLMPSLGENEMMMVNMQGLQDKRRDLVESYLNQTKLPQEHIELVQELNDEQEANVYLNKNATEQRITIEALKDVLEGHRGYYSSLKDIYNSYRQSLEGLNEDLKIEQQDYKNSIQELHESQIELKDEIDEAKHFKNSNKSLEFDKFDDKYKLEEVSDQLTEIIYQEIDSQNSVLNSDLKADLKINLENTTPSELVEVVSDVANLESEIKQVQSHYEKLIRDKLVLEKKLDLCQNQTEDKNKIEFIEQNI